MDNCGNLDGSNEINSSEEVQFCAANRLGEEVTFGKFLDNFETLKIESENEGLTTNVDETGDLVNGPTHRLYQEQLEAAMNKMGITMDDYLKARTVWSGDASLGRDEAISDSTGDKELSQLGLNEEEIKDVNEIASSALKREEIANLSTAAQNSKIPLLTSDSSAAEVRTGNRYKDIAREIQKNSEYIQSIPKWQTEMQKRLDMLKQIRLDIEADYEKKRQEGITDAVDMTAEIKRRLADLSASIEKKNDRSESV